MIIGLLICTIGLIPIVLAINVNRIYKGSDLSVVLLLYMISITIWQFNIGILYFQDLFSKETILTGFRIFRAAPTFAIPVVFYVAYEIFKKYSTSFEEGEFLKKVLQLVFTRKVLIGLTVWSSIIYVLNWTKLGIQGLKLESIYQSGISYYFPEYGPLYGLYIFHMCSVIIFLIFMFILSRKIINPNIKRFLSVFSLCSFLLFIAGLFNFSPATGSIASSIGVIIFSVSIMLEFYKMNTIITLNYNQLVERQKKLDYTGNLVGSLIHEVKNTNQIIKGFLKILGKSDSLSEVDKSSLEMIVKASEQLENLSNTFRDYIDKSHLDFKMEDINQIIERAIDLSKEMLRDHRIEIEFTKSSKNLKASVNQTYLRQVFINLIKNSCEAMPNNREIRKIIIHAGYIGETIVINFEDTAKGIPPEEWETIFDPFITSNDKGMGLGLAFVKKIIFEHRGDIAVINSSSSGTLFQIKISQFEVISSETHIGHVSVN